MHALRLTLLAALALSIAACSPTGDTASKRGAKRPARAVLHIDPNPVEVSPLSYQTCTQHYGFTVGSPQYKKCIANLSQLETAPAK